MRRFNLFVGSTAAMLLTPVLALAQSGTGIVSNGSGGTFGQLLRNIIEFSNTTLIPFIIGIGFLVFVWGMFKYFILGGANEDAQKEGKSLMIYATLGFLFIIIFWGIVNLLASSVGLQGSRLQNIPSAPYLNGPNFVGPPQQ